MVEIEPYDFQKKTNIKEHNDLVAKINEIVDVINNTNLDTITPRINKIETDISGINSTDALQWQDIETLKGDVGAINPKITKLEQDVTDINSTDAIQNTNINNLKTKDSEHDTRLGTIDTEINGINKSLVSDVAILNGTTSGNVKVRIGRKDTPSIDSNDYNIQKPTSVELVQGSAPAMVKAQITLSDGTVLVSDDFMFTTEAIGQDVYISSFVFKNGNVAGTISADIGLSNGSTLEANNFAVPTDPNVTSAISGLQGRVTTVENDVSGLKTTVNGHTTTINGLDSEVSDLQTRMTAVEGGTIIGLDKLKQTVDGHTASISALDSDVANLQIDKADVSTVDTLRNTVNGKVNIAQGTANAGKVLGINASGNVEPTEVSSGGEVWEEVNLSAFPTDWVDNERFKIQFKTRIFERTGDIVLSNGDFYKSEVMELRVNSAPYKLINFSMVNSILMSLYIEQINPVNYFNGNRQVLIQLRYSLMNISSSSYKSHSTGIARDTEDMTNYIYKIWRLKK